MAAVARIVDIGVEPCVNGRSPCVPSADLKTELSGWNSSASCVCGSEVVSSFMLAA